MTEEKPRRIDTYNGVYIQQMELAELEAAKVALEHILAKALARREAAMKDPRWKKKFKNQPPPTTNSAFVILKDTIDKEIKIRKSEKENTDG